MKSPATWFDRPARLAALEAAAQRWSGTPFAPRSGICGKGVCCHLLVAEVLFESGAVPRTALPNGSPSWARHQSTSPMETWMDSVGADLFSSIDPPAEMVPGDVIGCRIGRVVHHLAIVLEGGRYAHAMEGHGAVIAQGLPRGLDRRIARIWRVRP